MRTRNVWPLLAVLTVHDPNGGVVTVDLPNDTAIIVRPVPPGYRGHGQVETDAGKVITQESPDELRDAIKKVREQK